MPPYHLALHVPLMNYCYEMCQRKCFYRKKQKCFVKLRLASNMKHDKYINEIDAPTFEFRSWITTTCVDKHQSLVVEE